ncbi:MAG: hypothetical protein LBE70_03740 [Nitrososphaerota archaeon]|jgi:hypothetical protein|nr:hypothetical protein [Nitrososphaerota archaeon]
MNDILREYLKNNLTATIRVLLPDLLTPLVLSLGKYSSLVGANNPLVYKKLICHSAENPYKISVIPITEGDLR